MPTQQDVSHHYTRGNLVAAIRGGVEALGKTINSITIDDLAPVDEYHIVAVRRPKISLVSSTSLPKNKCLMLDVGLGEQRALLPAAVVVK